MPPYLAENRDVMHVCDTTLNSSRRICNVGHVCMSNEKYVRDSELGPPREGQYKIILFLAKMRISTNKSRCSNNMSNNNSGFPFASNTSNSKRNDGLAPQS